MHARREGERAGAPWSGQGQVEARVRPSSGSGCHFVQVERCVTADKQVALRVEGDGTGGVGVGTHGAGPAAARR